MTTTDRADIDRRSDLFHRLTQDELADVAATWLRTTATPESVAGILAESRRLFVGASQCYANFAAAPLAALHAADLALKLRVGLPPADTRTMGMVIKLERETHPVLSTHRQEWFSEFALYFRNKLSHPQQSAAFSPGMSAPMMQSIHEAVAEVFPD